MKIYIYYILLIIVISTNDGFSLDTIRHFENIDSHYILNDKNINEYAERFIINFDAEILGLRLKVNGPKGDKGTIKFYGNEVSDVIPTKQITLIEDINFEKKVNESEWININFENPISYTNKQIFVSIKFDNKSSNIYTDKSLIKPDCISENCNSLSHQLVLNEENKWKMLESSFLVELFVNKNNNNQDSNFQVLTFSEIEGIELPINSISIFDINNDGNQDIITNQYLLLNKGQDIFNLSKLIDTNSNCIANIIINDPIRPRIVSFFKNTNTHLIHNYNINGNEIVFITDSFKLEYDFQDIQSYSLKDLNDDNYLDIVLAINNESNSELLVLKHSENNLYEKSFTIPTNKISTISFNPLIDYKNQLLINYISNKMEIYEIDNSGLNVKTNTISTDSMNTDFYISDINNDSKVDLIATNQYIPSINIQDFDEYELSMNQLQSLNSDDNELFSPTVEDFDNNGYKDILVTTRCDCRRGSIFYQDISGDFKENTLISGFNQISIGPSIIKVDLNNDGKMDFLSLSDKKLIGFMNNSNNRNNYIQFSDKKNEVNEVIVFTENNKYVSVAVPNGRSYNVQEPKLFHIGIPENELIDSVIIRNRNGQKTYTDIDLNNKYDIDDLNSKNSQSLISDNFFTTPNPFKSKVSIIINLPESKKLKTIRIYNLNGEVVFQKEITTQKKVNWNGKNMDGIPVTSGAYIATLESEGIVLKNKLLKID